MISLGLAFVLQSSILSDARLAKSSDFDVSLRQIGEFVAKVSRDSGVDLSVSKNLLDLKVDVFVDGKPTGETLDKIAKVFNCDWVPTENGYRLEMEAKYVNRERNFNQAEDDEDLRQLKVMLWAREYVSNFFPPSNATRHTGDSYFTVEQRDKITGPFEKEYHDAEKASDKPRMRAAFEKWAWIENSLGDYMFGSITSQFDKNAYERFWRGDPFVASTFKGGQYRLSPSDVTLNGYLTYPGPDGKSIETPYEHCAFFRFDPIAGRIRMNMESYSIRPKEFGGISTCKSGGGFAYSSTSNPISENLMVLPFYTDLKPWINQETTPLKFPQAIDKTTKEWPSPWTNQRRRLGEHLRWLHKATGIPIVAQADRSCTWNWIKLNRGFDNANQYVGALMNDTSALVQEDHGYLMARNPLYWRHRRHEAPETVWAQIEPKDSTVDATFNDFVNAAQLLREDQMFSREIGYPLTSFDIGTVGNGYDSLRLYAMLSPDQRAAAKKDSGIFISELGTAQQKQMEDTVIKLILESGTCSYDLAKTLVLNGVSAGQLQNLCLKLRITDFPVQNHYTDELKDGDTVLVKRGMTSYAVSHASFSYECGPKESVDQWIQFKKP